MLPGSVDRSAFREDPGAEKSLSTGRGKLNHAALSRHLSHFSHANGSARLVRPLGSSTPSKAPSQHYVDDRQKSIQSPAKTPDPTEL